MAKKKIVIGVIGSDCHTVGNKIIHNKLEESGFDVVNIGALSPQIDFINAALETNSDAIIVSSIYGYGELDCQGIREKCNEYGLKDILLYIGGNIGYSESSVANMVGNLSIGNLYVAGNGVIPIAAQCLTR